MTTPDRIRLLKVVPTLLCGGTETQFISLGRSLDPQAFDLRFACLRRLGPFVEELDDRRIPLVEYRIRTFRSAGSLWQQGRLARHILGDRIDIVHTYNFYGNVFAIPAARVAGTPVTIASIRDRGLYLTPLQKQVQRHVCRLADCVLVNADAVKDWLAGEGYDVRRIAVIRNGVDLGRFERDRCEHDAGWLRGELGWPADAPVVGVVSRLNPLKGLEQFLEAAALVGQRRPETRFVVIGEPRLGNAAYQDELCAHARRLGLAGRVVFMGLRSDVARLLGEMTVSVMPSLNEALSNVLLESMAASAPIVATRVGGTPEAIVDGVNGLLVPPADVRSLAAAISRLLDTPALARGLGCAARRSVEERFSMDRMVDATAQLYRSLLEEKTGRARHRPNPEIQNRQIQNRHFPNPQIPNSPTSQIPLS